MARKILAWVLIVLGGLSLPECDGYFCHLDLQRSSDAEGGMLN